MPGKGREITMLQSMFNYSTYVEFCNMYGIFKSRDTKFYVPTETF
jgi:hypothetical protein